MGRFLNRLCAFLTTLCIILGISLWYIPNPEAETNLLGALIDKHRMLERTPSSRLLFIGGSNVSFGINSKLISDSLHLPVRNMGLHAGLGLKFILDDIRPYIKKHDVVVLMPEYQYFYGENFWGNIELVSILFDIFPSGWKYVNLKQAVQLMNFIPVYAAKKMKYIFSSASAFDGTHGIYGRKSFNEYGDAVNHWALPNLKITPENEDMTSPMVNPEVIDYLKSFKLDLSNKGASFYIFPPAFQQSSYINEQVLIRHISANLKTAGIPFEANPARYCFPDTSFFDAIYHLDRKGAILRSKRVVEDLSKIMHEF